jgi:biofilm PGA synthesis N-glycosyltransferase PgaC
MVRYVVVTPVRDEVQYIGQTVTSLRRQTVLPAQWIVVDDGSSDGTGEMLDVYARETNWLKVIHRRDRGYRAAGSGVIDAFNAGYSSIDSDGWEFLVKLDGDLSFSSDYFEECFRRFVEEPRLGIAGGTVYQIEGSRLKVDSEGDPPFHVRGATKVYRRACWETELVRSRA